MIIKTGGIAAGDGPRITQYAVSTGENERVEVIRDDNEQLLIGDEFAALKGRKNGLLHIIISPDQDLSADELNATIDAIRTEFGFNSDDPETLAMHEKIDADGFTRQHWHWIRPAADSESGQTYRMFRSKAKDEAVSRLMELELGHKITSGANNKFAIKRMREIGRDDYAEQLELIFQDQPKPKAAFSHADHQHAKRKGFDLPGLRQQIKEVAELDRADQPRALAELIDRSDLQLSDAIEEGRGRSRISLELPNGLRPHNANRTLKIRAAEVAAFTHQTKEILDDLRTNTRPDPERSVATDHSGAGNVASVDDSNDSAPKRATQNSTGDQQELTGEGAQLATAAAELKPQIKRFSENRAGDLTAGDMQPAPDINDPNLLRKLAAMLRRQIDRANATLKSAFPVPKPGGPR